MESLPEHKFYFGLGFILRLRLFDQNVVAFEKDKIKVKVNIENLQKILQEIGEPISERPQLSESKKKDLFSEFLYGDIPEFQDIEKPKSVKVPKEPKTPRVKKDLTEKPSKKSTAQKESPPKKMGDKPLDKVKSKSKPKDDNTVEVTAKPRSAKKSHK
jgi:hypothetical protein